MTPEQMREQFEAWYTRGQQGKHARALERDENGYYFLMATLNAWAVWEAATSSSEERVKKLREALTNLLWYVGQLETLVYTADDKGEHEEVAAARKALEDTNG